MQKTMDSLPLWSHSCHCIRIADHYTSIGWLTWLDCHHNGYASPTYCYFNIQEPSQDMYYLTHQAQPGRVFRLMEQEVTVIATLYAEMLWVIQGNDIRGTRPYKWPPSGFIFSYWLQFRNSSHRFRTKAALGLRFRDHPCRLRIYWGLP